jgi:hypothetical protein
MRIALIAMLVLPAAAFLGGCGEKTAEAKPLSDSEQKAAAQKQQGAGGVKASNGGGVFPVTDPPPPPGAKLGPPQVGGKAGGN